MREAVTNNKKAHRQHVTRALQRHAGIDRPWQPGRCTDVDTAQRLAAMRSLLSLLEHGVIADVGDMLRHWQCCLLLSDRDGVVVKRWGDAQLMSAAQGDWLMPGASWSEAHCGCNAIGTCLVEREAIDVIAGEHTCEQMQHLAGFAVPLKTPHGIIDGCLALISDPYRDRTHRHSGLLQVLSMQIENRRLINLYRHDHYRLTFNSSHDNLDSPRSGLLIFDTLGRLAASNTRARWLLGLDGEHDRGRHFESLCNAGWQETITRDENTATLRFAGRYHCHCRLEPPPQGSRAASASPLERLDLGDPRLHQSIMLASRLKDRGIAMLIHGETGTGKEVFVKALHASSRRADQPLVAINCAAIPGDLVEAELFGYVRGAFTGADPRGNIGRLREANGGRLFLDEIGDMPLGVQARLLRVLQERRVTPLGGGDSYPVDIEVIAATHRPLAQEIAAGRFRADLYYRLCGVELILPPLREREDIRALIQVLLTNQIDGDQPASEQRESGVIPTPTPELMEWLVRQPWPGNIREMENVLRVSLAMADGPALALHHLPINLLVSDAAPVSVLSPNALSVHSIPTTPRQPSHASLKERLAEHRGNHSALARELGISRTTLYKRLRNQSEALPT